MKEILLLSTWCILVSQCFGQIGSEFNFGREHAICENDENCVDFHQCMDREIANEHIKICGDELICCKNVNQAFWFLLTKPFQSRVRCGRRNSGGFGFSNISSSESLTNYGEFPWMAAVLEYVPYDDQTLKVFQCGGSVIHPEIILTAAHCVITKTVEHLLIRAGEWDTQLDTEPFPHQNRNVSRVILHPNYNSRTLSNDIALMILNEPLELNEVIHPVCLPPPDSETVEFDTSQCVVTGWGKDQFSDEGRYQVILKKVNVSIVNRPECQHNLRQTRLGRNFPLHESFICAGGEEGRDSCKGDGGSPLVCPVLGHKDRYYQYGIVSWGVECGMKDIPGVYASVSYQRRWIDEQMDLLHLSKWHYTRKVLPRRIFIG